MLEPDLELLTVGAEQSFFHDPARSVTLRVLYCDPTCSLMLFNTLHHVPSCSVTSQHTSDASITLRMTITTYRAAHYHHDPFLMLEMPYEPAKASLPVDQARSNAFLIARHSNPSCFVTIHL